MQKLFLLISALFLLTGCEMLTASPSPPLPMYLMCGMRSAHYTAIASFFQPQVVGRKTRLEVNGQTVYDSCAEQTVTALNGNTFEVVGKADQNQIPDGGEIDAEFEFPDLGTLPSDWVKFALFTRDSCTSPEVYEGTGVANFSFKARLDLCENESQIQTHVFFDEQ